MKKVFLIFPPFHHHKLDLGGCVPPLGLAYLASVLHGEHEVEILDAFQAGYDQRSPIPSSFILRGLNASQIRCRIERYAPDIVGISCVLGAQIPYARMTARLSKQVNQNVPVVMGGGNPTYLYKEILEEEEAIDFIVRGEGEVTFPALLQAIEDGRDPSELDGIALRKNGETMITGERELVGDLDTIPFPARYLLDMEGYLKIGVPQHFVHRRKRFFSMITSRGCDQSCHFCATAAYWKRRFRGRKPERVLNEIEMLVDDFSAQEINFLDDNMTVEPERACEIFQGILDRGLDIVWNCPQGISIYSLNNEMLDLMKASGCYEVNLAIENGNQEFLDEVIGKPIDLEAVRRIVKRMDEIDLDPHGVFIIGFPQETTEELSGTLQYARSLPLSSTSLFFANALVGSKLHDELSEQGLLTNGFDPSKNDFRCQSIPHPTISRDRLDKIMIRSFLVLNLLPLFRHPLRFIRRWYRIFASRPSEMLRVLFASFRGAI